ncbi:MAG: triose-phosphate isomerase [Clostridia bacterium]|nr:triose-phosphate isomerase [Clostridia bacterium]
MAYYCKKTVADIDCAGKKVIVRVDFNVPFDSEGNISDDKRIVGALPTIKYLLDKNAAVILVSHLGRPKGEFNLKYSMAPASKRLSELLGKEVIQAQDVIGPDAKAKAEALKPGQIMMLENARFHKEEEKNNPEFAKELASMAELYVNDAFGTAHRAHATTAGIADYLPAVSGFLIEKEINFLGNAVNNPEHPFVAILGGAKVADKLTVISSLLEKCDTLIIGGGMAYTFLKAQGYGIGTSLCDDEKLDYCKSMIEKAEKLGKKLLLPVDATTIAEFPNPIDAPVVTAVYGVDSMPDDRMGCDIGPETCKLFAEEVKNAKTVVWNGPMGVFENPILAQGTVAVAEAMAASDATTIVGGGDSAAAVEQLGFAGSISHISTGGGASLEFLEGRDLPGISCLENKDRKIVAAGNWKMNKTPSQAAAFIKELAEAVKGAKNQVICAVPFVAIPAALEAAKGTYISIAAQTMDYHDKGAYTGEVSAEMLADLGVKYVIIGHSERRQYYNETDETVNLKVKQALKYGLTPIVCVGESKDQRLAGVTNELVAYQVEYALNGVRDDQAAGIIIAYEPIWAIGTGLTATDDQAQEVCKAIRDTICKLYGKNVSSVITIQYGGSCNAKNAAGLFAMPDIDGGLVGGASLKVPDFAVIANS